MKPKTAALGAPREHALAARCARNELPQCGNSHPSGAGVVARPARLRNTPQ
jgi:hypothetical protein